MVHSLSCSHAISFVLTASLRNTFLGAIRTSTTLPTSILESIICRVAVLNRAWYEWQQHLPLLLAASDVQIERDYVRAIFSQPPGTWNGNHVPSVKHALALEYTDFLTLACEVEDQMFSKMKVAFAEREIVEITATCSAYNCVSRFLLALDVGEQNGHSGLKAAIAQTEELQDDAIPASRSVAETSR